MKTGKIRAKKPPKTDESEIEKEMDQLEGEWQALEDWLGEKKQLETELANIRTQLSEHHKLRIEKEQLIKAKEEEIERLSQEEESGENNEAENN